MDPYQEKIYAFDSLYTTNHIQMLKILLPCLTPPFQKNLALYIKFLEFTYTLSYVQSHPYVIKGCGFEQEKPDLSSLSKELLPFCSPEEGFAIKQILKGFDTMKQFENMQKMMEDMKDLFPEGFDFSSMFEGFSGADGSPDFTSMFNGKNKAGGFPDLSSMFSAAGDGTFPDLSSMMSPEQKDMYEEMSRKFDNL